MNINAITFNTSSANQQKNSPNNQSFQKTKALAQDTVSFSAINFSPKMKEIREIHLKIAQLLQKQKGVAVFPHQRLSADIGLNSADLTIFEQKINSALLKGKPCRLAISNVTPKKGDMSVRELAEKVYNYRHSWGRN
ncbi:MAG: hypothetical protein PHX18_02785 [Candidatus Gastranaerophilales bacterium]|nr:hypothetical protein [Candidatus Gastranaerophilales bacterium]